MSPNPHIEIKIQEPTQEQVDQCYDIVQSLSSEREDASKKGFMHAHQSREDWERYIQPKRFYVATSNNKVSGFVILVPLGGPDTAHLLGARGTTEWLEEGILDIPNLLFIEKVSVDPLCHGQGIGRKLYEHMFNEHPNSTFFTALVEKPLHNIASEEFHTKLGFHRVGTFRDGSFGALDEYQSGIFLRKV